jgi:hypothetical protein
MTDCTQCGKALTGEAAFCGACGAPVVPTGAGTGAPADAAPTTPPAVPPVATAPATNIVMIAALAVIAVVAVIGIIFVADRHSGSTTNPTGIFQSQMTNANDASVRQGIHSIQVGIQSWAIDNGDTFPPATGVTKFGGVGTYVNMWPTNPYSGQPMAPRIGSGDFTYTLDTNGLSYTLSGHLSTGDFTVP